MNGNILQCVEFAIAELQSINEESALTQVRAALQEAINLLNEAEQDLTKLETLDN